jgi:hypothetical protein
MSHGHQRGDSGERPPGYDAQPKFETLVMRGPRRFALTTRLPSGERVDVPLGRLSIEMRREPPRP